MYANPEITASLLGLYGREQSGIQTSELNDGVFQRARTYTNSQIVAEPGRETVSATKPVQDLETSLPGPA